MVVCAIIHVLYMNMSQNHNKQKQQKTTKQTTKKPHQFSLSVIFKKNRNTTIPCSIKFLSKINLQKYILKLDDSKFRNFTYFFIMVWLSSR